jgi:uncharacterized membrane protein YraQ (UPF0718 family)
VEALIANLVALGAAPLLARLLRGRPRVEGFTDGLVQVVVGGLLVVHVLLFGLAAVGWPALLALGAGVAVGVFAHRLPGGEKNAVRLAMVALVLHGLVDGAALRSPDEHDEEALIAWAVVLHTVPVGLATWRIGAARGGPRLAAALLLMSAIATAVGWFGAGRLLHGAPPAILGVAQCLVAGALLHVLGHLGQGLSRRAGGAGALVGVGVVGLLAADHPIPLVETGELGAGQAMLALLQASAPSLLLGYLAAGLLHAFVPPSLLGRLRGRTGLGAALRGALVGLIVPVCSCGALPAYRRLQARGAPPAAGLSFLVAGPEIGPSTLLVSLPLLGLPFTLARAAAAVAVALVVGASVGPEIPPPPAARPAPQRAPRRSLSARLREALRFGFVETVDHTAPWVIAGLGLAALTEPLLSPVALAGLPRPLAVLAAAAIGVPAYVCASGATPLIAVLLHKGLGAGAALAFLLTGPATNLATFGLLKRLHGKRVALLFGLGVGLTAVLIGLAFDYGLPDLAPLALHGLSVAEPPLFPQVAAGLVLVLFASALLRNGPEGFLEPMVHPHHEDGAGGHSHTHGHAHGHIHVAGVDGLAGISGSTRFQAGQTVPRLAPLRRAALPCAPTHDPGPRADAPNEQTAHDHDHDHDHDPMAGNTGDPGRRSEG